LIKCWGYILYIYIYILGVVKRKPIFLHEIEWKNNGFLFTTSNIYIYRANICVTLCQKLWEVKKKKEWKEKEEMSRKD